MRQRSTARPIPQEGIVSHKSLTLGEHGDSGEGRELEGGYGRLVDGTTPLVCRLGDGNVAGRFPWGWGWR